MPYQLTYLALAKGYQNLWFHTEAARDSMVEYMVKYKLTESYVLSYANAVYRKKNVASYERVD